MSSDKSGKDIFGNRYSAVCLAWLPFGDWLHICYLAIFRYLV
jgi:hypothetical protein